jgi:L-2,4-diaminobutyrate decarboxylase
MTSIDDSFTPAQGLNRALTLLRAGSTDRPALPDQMPDLAIGEAQAIELLAGHVLGKAARLGTPSSLAHMDPPTPWITWAMALWNASLNQNMLHGATSPFAQEAESRVIAWLNPYFGMSGGHFCAGSTVANLTALWAARDAAAVRTVYCSEAAHISVEKACRLLGLDLHKVPVDKSGRMDVNKLPDLQDACLVLTAGTTSCGAIDPLTTTTNARWTHIDAAWAGSLRMSPTHASKLSGLEHADSVAISAHKWFFQPKDSAIVFFKDIERANPAISMSGGYLAKPNIGVQGSRSAAAIPLLATLLAWGRSGLVQRLDHLMNIADRLADSLEQSGRFELWNRPATGINVFRPLNSDAASFVERLPAGMFSTCQLSSGTWVRSVAANPCADGNMIAELSIAAAAPLKA